MSPDHTPITYDEAIALLVRMSMSDVQRTDDATKLAYIASCCIFTGVHELLVGYKYTLDQCCAIMLEWEASGEIGLRRALRDTASRGPFPSDS